ncbi:hypothetical protein GALL_103440 [mine drainage metagenome]|uniref:DUF4007 domain-containing protein n=1 Tax=mine drainage metagenome TaxID=410659 RepID=A0A1J5T0L3_9ZZZZ
MPLAKRRPLSILNTLSANATASEPLGPQSAAAASERFLFAGHQTFALRISWLPKAATVLANGIDPFANPREGMMHLGIGRNMVEALRCWVQLYGVARFGDSGPKLTEFGDLIFGSRGFDPFLEDERTLWLLHWNAATNRDLRFFAWHWVCNILSEPEFTYGEALRAFKAQTETKLRPLSPTTLRQHLDVFLSTYVQSATPLSGMVAEDLLESPLAVLGFIQRGEPRAGAQAKDIPYSVDVGPKSGISDELLRLCLHQGWPLFAGMNETISYREVGHAANSPGRIFRLPERDLHERLQRLAANWPNEFQLLESNNQRQLRRFSVVPRFSNLLRSVYEPNG